MPAQIEYLKKHFGYESFRPLQEEIIHCALSNRDSLVLMPTGGGKSLCFQLPALMSDGLVVVISPLMALMKDQVDALKANGISAAYLNSSLSKPQQEKVIENLRTNKYKLLYLAPERLMYSYKSFIQFLSGLKISLYAVDEAHCISHWGHDFREEYLQLGALKEMFPHIPVMALTASADAITRNDIIEKLQLKDAGIFISSFNRPNIFYFIEAKKNYANHLLNYLHRHKEESGIIYCFTRASTEALAEELRMNGFHAVAYHAGMETKARNEAQEKFQRDEVKIIVATIAFGMGIDKSNVRFVIHTDVPKNMESYYQETGRAGRDGLRSDAILYYSSGDIIKLKRFVEIDDNKQQSEIMLKKLRQMAHFAESSRCRRNYILDYFGESSPEYCGSCDVCLTNYELFDGTVVAQKALSAVARLKEKFGMTMVIDFLRGSDSKRITPDMRGLKTYGAGKDITAEQWQLYFRSLLHKGLLAKDEGTYPVLKLTDKSQDVLRGNVKVELVKHIERKSILEQEERYDAELLQLLKNLRQQIAHRERVPAYIILGDNTLQELATFFPQKVEEIEKISGFGEYKVKKYGKAFSDLIGFYCSEKNIASRIDQKIPKRRRKKNRLDKESSSKMLSLRLLNEGKSVAEIASVRSLAPGTIMSHLTYFIRRGEVSPVKLMEKSKCDFLKEEILKYHPIRLSELKNIVGENYSYDEIRMVMAHLEFLGELQELKTA